MHSEFSPSRCSYSGGRSDQPICYDRYFVCVIITVDYAVHYASECCDEYKTYTTLYRRVRVVFRFLAHLYHLS